MESSWTGQMKGLDLFPSGEEKGMKIKVLDNKVSISNWQGNTHYRRRKRNIIYLEGRKINMGQNTLY